MFGLVVVIEEDQKRRGWSGAGVGVGVLRGGGDSKIIQDLLRFQDIDFPRCTTIIQDFIDSEILIFQLAKISKIPRYVGWRGVEDVDPIFKISKKQKWTDLHMLSDPHVQKP